MLKKISKENQKEFASYLKARSLSISPAILQAAAQILADVEENGDKAVREYTKKFDKVELENFKVEQKEIDAQAKKADADFVKALKKAAANIEAFHKKQIQQGYEMEMEEGSYGGIRVMPLDSAGIYVPGGRAQYPSSVLMNAIPAKVAGVKRIVMVTPPDANGSISPNLAAAARVAGVSEIYTVGGAQGVAALAYGTESIAPVDKIVGPGNIYVAAAKKLVYGTVDVDMIAGPSEILVIADESADPAFVAADLISQAEHDPMASAILLTTSEKIADQVKAELARQAEERNRTEIIKPSLENYGIYMICESLEDAADTANQIAPEHLELQVEDPKALLPFIKHAGSVFMGRWTCESIGDYFGGPNHVLPTCQTARFSSPLSVDDFIKKSSYLNYSPEALEKNGHHIETLARHEGLDGHAYAVTVRLERLKEKGNE